MIKIFGKVLRLNDEKYVVEMLTTSLVYRNTIIDNINNEVPTIPGVVDRLKYLLKKTEVDHLAYLNECEEDKIKKQEKIEQKEINTLKNRPFNKELEKEFLRLFDIKDIEGLKKLTQENLDDINIILRVHLDKSKEIIALLKKSK